MGQRDLRRLLIMGAMAVVQNAIRRGEITDPWLARMVARKPKMLVAVALANRRGGGSGRWPRERRTIGFAMPPDRAVKGEAAGRCGQQGRKNG